MHKKTGLLLFFIVFADMMGFSVIFPLFPETIRYYLEQGNDAFFTGFYNLAIALGENATPEQIIVLFGGILGSIYALLQFVFAPIWGKMSDRWGRKNILIFTSLGNLLGYVVWLFSSSFSLFLLSRVITGAMGGNISVASAAMADVTSRADRAKGMGMIGAGIGLGFIFGPTLGGLLSGLEIYNLIPSLSDSLFTVFSLSAMVSLSVAFVNLLLVMFVLKETLPLRTNEKAPESEAPRLHPFLGIFSDSFQSLLFISLIQFFFIFSFSGFEFSLNFFLHEVLGYTPKEIGFTFFFIGIIIVLIQGGLIRRISGKVPEVKIALSGVIAISLGYTGLLVFGKPGYGFFLYCSLGALAVGSALLHPALSAIASLGSSVDDQGKNLGIFRSFGSLARAISPFSFALVYFGYGPYVVFILALLISLGFGLALRLRIG